MVPGRFVALFYGVGGESMMTDLHSEAPDLIADAKRLCARRGIDSDALLTRDEAAEFLGVSRGTLARWGADTLHPLPFISLFSRCRYRAIDVAVFFLRAQVPAAESRQARAAATRRARGDRLGRPPAKKIGGDACVAA
jgi:hypothetical protein